MNNSEAESESRLKPAVTAVRFSFQPGDLSLGFVAWIGDWQGLRVLREPEIFS